MKIIKSIPALFIAAAVLCTAAPVSFTGADVFAPPAGKEIESVTAVSQSPETDKNISVDGYVVTRTQGGVTATYKGRAVTKTYLAIKQSGGTPAVVSPAVKGAKIYRFNKKGIGKPYKKTKIVNISFGGKQYSYYVKKGKTGTGWLDKKSGRYYYASGLKVTGWKKIKKKYYYFDKKKNGKLSTNQIIYGKSSWYVDETGARVSDDAIRRAVSYVQKHTDSGWSAPRKLSACYNYLVSHYRYGRYYGIPNSQSLPNYAVSMFSSGSGNCFCFATTFAYIAKVLGYDSRSVVGSISNLDGGMTPHGWTEVKSGGIWYICDADMQVEDHGRNLYMRGAGSYPYPHAVSRKYEITVSQGKVAWK